MTLPQPNKPDIDDVVSDIISDTLENEQHLDTLQRYKHVVFTKDISTLTVNTDTDQTVTGVGFEPAVILLFGELDSAPVPFDDLSFGIYGNYPQFGTGTNYEINDRLLLGSWTTGLSVYGVSFVPVTGKVSSTNSDGFVFTWNKSETQTGTVTVIAFCMR